MNYGQATQDLHEGPFSIEKSEHVIWLALCVAVGFGSVIHASVVKKKLSARAVTHRYLASSTASRSVELSPRLGFVAISLVEAIGK